MIEISFVAGEPPVDAMAVLVREGVALSPAATDVDARTGGAVARALDAARAKGKTGERFELLGPPEVGAARVMMLGVGAGEPGHIETAVAGAVRALLTSGAASLLVRLDGDKISADTAARAGLAAQLASYRFDSYRTKLAEEKRPTLTRLAIACDDPGAAAARWESLGHVAAGVAFARDLVNEPPNIVYPETFVERLATLSEVGVELEVLDEAQMSSLGMGALLAVGQGSARASRLAVMRWNGGGEAAPLAFVGKGVTFDAGGISLKPGAGMDEMKGDMGGAAAVAGLMRAVAGRKAKANVVGIVGLVENMPDGAALRPGDIITSMSGQTIEVLNTDAEGRLVLADALWYCEERFKPQ
ncbi:MAG: leucyl aminopeptidase, partial [Caulobacterales bacterium]|nr:leucyl aminopeptidase [Caulobacterales bacterium]